MLRASRAAGIALVVALIGFTACDKENPVAPVLPPTSTPAAGPLAVTIAWAVAPPAKSVRIGDNSQSYIFTATVTGGVAPYTFAWQFGDGTPLGAGNPVTHQFSQPWTYQMWVTVTDAAGNVVRSDVKGPFEVEVTASRFVVTCFVGPPSGAAPLDVELDAVADGNVGGVSWRWDFGDGTSSTSRRTRHVYGSGTFTATATATDGHHRTASCSKSISAVCAGSSVYHLDATCSHGIHISYDFIVPAGSTQAEVLAGILDLWAFFGDPLTVNSVTFVRCEP